MSLHNNFKRSVAHVTNINIYVISWIVKENKN